MPDLDRNQLTEIAGRAQIDPRTAERLYAKFRAGDVPAAIKLAAELARLGIVVSASASGAE
jgi:hypothetical protein